MELFAFLQKPGYLASPVHPEQEGSEAPGVAWTLSLSLLHNTTFNFYNLENCRIGSKIQIRCSAGVLYLL